jgi:hypothetical protein
MANSKGDMPGQLVSNTESTSELKDTLKTMMDDVRASECQQWSEARMWTVTRAV